MFLLRLTSGDSVRGIESDDGFIIGRFTVDTANLLITTAVMGAMIGLVMMAGRPFFPKRHMPFAWTAAGALIGGAIFVQSNGVDFTALEPHWLAVSLFVALPGGGAFLIAWLTEQYARFWWRTRGATVAASLAAIPAVIFFPLGIVTLLVAGAWLLALRLSGARAFPNWRPARLSAAGIFGVLLTLGALDLTRDAQAIL